MTDLIKRALNYVMAALLVPASRLVRMAALRQLIEAYTNAYEEAARLEASGKPALAQFLRAELEDALGDDLAATPTPQTALDGDSNHHPFALPCPDAAANQSEGQGSPPARRRGRRPGSKGAQPAHEAPPQQAPEPADPTTSPIPNSNHRP